MMNKISCYQVRFSWSATPSDIIAQKLVIRPQYNVQVSGWNVLWIGVISLHCYQLHVKSNHTDSCGR